MQHELQRNSDTMSPYNRMFYDREFHHERCSMTGNSIDEVIPLWFYHL